jgi:hypothetical protein
MKLNAKGATGRPEYCAVVLTLAMIAACSDAVPITGPRSLPDPAGPSAPAPPPPPAPVGSWIVRGVVVEYLPVFPDIRPAAGVPVRVFGGGRVVEAISRADGSFEADVPETAPFVRVVAAGPQYFSPCPGVRRAEDRHGEEPLEVNVVSGALLSNTRFWPNLPGGGGFVYGGVSEQKSAGGQGISGATVTVLGSAPLENPLAATLTDAFGFYTMCLPTRSTDYVVDVRKEGYVPASAPPAYWSALGWDFEPTDFVLTRR